MPQRRVKRKAKKARVVQKIKTKGAAQQVSVIVDQRKYTKQRRGNQQRTTPYQHLQGQNSLLADALATTTGLLKQNNLYQPTFQNTANSSPEMSSDATLAPPGASIEDKYDILLNFVADRYNAKKKAGMSPDEVRAEQQANWDSWQTGGGEELPEAVPVYQPWYGSAGTLKDFASQGGGSPPRGSPPRPSLATAPKSKPPSDTLEAKPKRTRRTADQIALEEANPLISGLGSTRSTRNQSIRFPDRGGGY